MLKIFIGINKHSRAKKSMSGLQKKNINTKYKEEEITTKLEGKRLSRSVPPEYRQPQKEISKPGSRPRHFPKINVSESHLSSRLECENGNKGDRTADKDSGGSSHKYPIVGLSKLKNRLINNKPGNIVYHDKKGVKINPRSKHSSSGIDEGASSMGLSLNNLNFMSLVRGNDETPSHKLSSNELNLAAKNDEKSVRMENDDGYETPNLGFQDHPSMKDL
mmetsp:Transcript_29493/g.29111  ORF Transcript_29493/g.29111 Transcript_29493/m.29111 type:complete len:219 (+) Transcript_29493:154-810(+)